MLVAAAARSRRRDDHVSVSALVDEIFVGSPRRTLPEPVARTLDALDRARRGRATLAA